MRIRCNIVIDIDEDVARDFGSDDAIEIAAAYLNPDSLLLLHSNDACMTIGKVRVDGVNIDDE